MTPQRAEPLPPVGVDTARFRSALVAAFGDTVGDDLFKWLSVDEPEWGRQNAKDAEALKAWCAEHNGKPA